MTDKQLIAKAKNAGVYKECRKHAEKRLVRKYSMKPVRTMLDFETIIVIKQYIEKGWM